MIQQLKNLSRRIDRREWHVVADGIGGFQVISLDPDGFRQLRAVIVFLPRRRVFKCIRAGVIGSAGLIGGDFLTVAEAFAAACDDLN